MTERHALLPLRAFLGVTFVYAGVDKLADPTFLRAGAFGSLATQLEAARGPFDGLLGSLVPHAGLLGVTVAVVEIVIGIAALTGVLTRASAAIGAGLCLAFGLTIGWGADPWYFGHDWPYLAAWLPLAIAGPGALTVPELLARLRDEDDDLDDDLLPPNLARRALLVQGAAVLAGATAVGGVAKVLASASRPARLVTTASSVATTPVTIAPRATTTTSTTAPPTTTTAPAPTTTTTAAPAAPAPATTAPPPATTSTTAAPPPTTTTTAAPAPTTTTTIPPDASLGPVVAASADVPTGIAVPFTDPRRNARGLLVRRSDGTVLAFDERCTHQGCSVLFIAEERRFGCPCHGSSFDADSGSVLQGPATARLPRWEVAELGGVIRLV